MRYLSYVTPPADVILNEQQNNKRILLSRKRHGPGHAVMNKKASIVTLEVGKRGRALHR